jgi:hypothetical protein
MKKLLVVLSVLFVVALLASSAFAVAMYDPEQRAAKLAEVKAAPLKMSGEFTFSTMTPFDAVDGAIGYANMYADFVLYPDEYNSILIEIAGAGATGFSSNVITVPYWELTTDVGKALDLPVGLMNTAGKTSLYTNKYEVSGLAYERTLVRTAIDPLAWKFKVTTDKVQATAALGFGEGADTLNDIGLYVFIPAVGPAEVELWYLVQNDADFKGKVGGSVKAKGLLNEMLDVAGGFVFDIRDGAIPEWAYGVGANVKYNKIRAAVSLNGNDVDTLRQLGFDANFAATDVFGLDAAVGLALADGADTFQGADISVYAKVGAAKWSVGYVIADGTSFAYVPAVGGINGGLYVAADIDF